MPSHYSCDWVGGKRGGGFSRLRVILRLLTHMWMSSIMARGSLQKRSPLRRLVPGSSLQETNERFALRWRGVHFPNHLAGDAVGEAFVDTERSVWSDRIGCSAGRQLFWVNRRLLREL